MPAATPSPTRVRRVRLAGALLLGAVAAGVAAGAAYRGALHRALDSAQVQAQRRLEAAVAGFEDDLARADVLPMLLATSPELTSLLADPDDVDGRRSAGRLLATLKRALHARAALVLDHHGRVLAGADDGATGRSAGQDLAAQPVVREALLRGHSRALVAPRTSGLAAYALPAAGTDVEGSRAAVQGVAVVEIDLLPLLETVRGRPGEVLVVDEHGRVALSTMPSWRQRTLLPAGHAGTPPGASPGSSPGNAPGTAAGKATGTAGLPPLDWHGGRQLTPHAQRVTVDGRGYLASDRTLPGSRWRLVLLDDETPWTGRARIAALAAGLAVLASLLLLQVRLQLRRVAARERASQGALEVGMQAARDALERRVQERAAALRPAEDERLRAGQQVVAARLCAGWAAAIGPALAVLRTCADDTVRRRTGGASEGGHDAVGPIASTVDRLERLHGLSEAFASSAEGFGAAVTMPVQGVLDEAMARAAPRLHELAVDVVVGAEPPGLAVLADPGLLPPVLRELVGGSIEALEQAPVKHLRVHARDHAGLVLISVRHSGCALHGGLGAPRVDLSVPGEAAPSALGLMLSGSLVAQGRGSLHLRNLEGGGVEFLLSLPRAAPGSSGP